MDRLPPLRLLHVFETVHRTSSPSRAATELNVSLSAVSQSLKQLEDHIGTSLLDRSTRPAGFTEAGEILLNAVVENRERLNDALEDIRALSDPSSAAVTLACTIGFATYWLMPRLEAFYLDHPDLAVNVQSTSQEVPRLGPGVDIAMRYGDGAWSDGAVELLFEERIEPVCAPEYLERIKADDGSLASSFLIHVETDDRRWVSWPDYLNRTGLKAAGSAKGLRFTNYVQAAQAALSGHGIMLGWRSITGDYSEKGLLAPAGLPPLTPKDAYHAVLSHRSRNKATAELVVSWLKQVASE
ncbi:LysR substrate-binding domain-containing protein [uncultured Roseibium sp.]|uniref:LysR substrate-binding domain-containing protein n=1 Tax=uncultured Roseibium sp. TaxID=1936171 RepID=UPI00263814EA|nr:LysR substrate-binding domain-containing protein [uncultured Roseibium sp.]